MMKWFDFAHHDEKVADLRHCSGSGCRSSGVADLRHAQVPPVEATPFYKADMRLVSVSICAASELFSGAIGFCFPPIKYGAINCSAKLL